MFQLIDDELLYSRTIPVLNTFRMVPSQEPSARDAKTLRSHDHRTMTALFGRKGPPSSIKVSSHKWFKKNPMSMTITWMKTFSKIIVIN
jgi:hypothetical protein